MRKVYLFSLLLALLMPWATKAQEDLTVAEGTSTTEYVPIYGYYADAYVHHQMIYPAWMLEEMTGGEVSQLTWYISTPAGSAWNCNATISVAEVGDTILTSNNFLSPELTTVWTGTPNGTASTMAIELDESFTYGGGNLLVDVIITSTGSYAHAHFFGISRSGSSLYGYDYSSLADITSANVVNVLPKCTFGYTPGGADICRKPNNLQVSDIEEESATFSWSARGEEGEWIVYLDGEELETVYDTSYTLSDLSPSMGYTVGVRAVCSSDNMSGISSTTFRTPCVAITALPWSEDFATADAATCWTILSYDYDTDDDWDYSSNGYMKTGFNASTEANDWLITPPISLSEAGNYLLEFRATGDSYSSYNSHLTVRLSTSGTDTASFTQLLFSEELPDMWDDYSALVALEEEATIYIAFIHDSFNDDGPSIDDVHFGVAPSCLRPEGVSVSAITENSATIVIDDPAEVGSYHLVVNQGSTVVFDEEISEVEYELTDLAPSTFYTVSVSAVCDDGNETSIRTTSFNTECAAIELPYSVSFAQTIDPCWNNPDGNMYISNGEQAVYTSSSNSRLISMAIPEPLSDKLVRIVWRGYSSNYSTQVGIGDQNGDNVQWIMTSPAVDDYTESMIFLNQYTGNDNHLVIGGGNGYVYIRSISIETVSGCTPVAGLHTENLTSTEATIAWNEVEDANGYIVEYRPTSTNQWTLVEDVDGTTATLSDLTATTDYTVRVRTDCGDDTSYTMTTSFTTLCGLEEFPWNCPQSDLYTIGNANWTSCWGYTSNVYRATSNGILYVYCQGANTEFRLPPVDITDFSQTQLRLHAACTTANAQFCVGVWDGVTEWIDTITATLTSSVTDAVEYVIPLGNYEGNGKVVVFGGVDNKSVYVQDFYIEPLDECPPVSSLTISDISESGAALSWVSNGAEGEWAVYLNGELHGTASETSYELSDLTSSTQYTVGVSAICGAGDTSRAVQASFRTTCAAIAALPWNEEFATADAIECWTILDNDNRSSDDWSRNSDGYMKTGYNNNAPANDWLITPPITIADDGNYLLEFRAKGSTFQSDSSHLTVRLSTSDSDTDSFTQQIFGQILPDNWDEYSAVFSVEGGETIYIAFIHDSYNDNGPSLDDVHFGIAPSCLRPNGVSVSDITENSATINIDDPAEVNNYHLVVKKGNTVVFDEVVTSTTYEVTELVASTTYTVNVSTVCDDETETSVRSTTFRTPCAAITALPWSEDFATADAVECWTILDNDNRSSDDWSRNSDGYMKTGYNSSEEANDWLITPPITIADAGNYLLEFRAKGSTYNNSYSSHLTVRLSTSGTDTASFTQQLLGETISDVWDDYSAVISVEGGETIYIAFIHDSYNDNGPSLDDINLDVAPSCLRPNGVSVSDITETTAIININDPIEVNNYHVIVKQGNTVLDDQMVSSTTYEVSGLSASTAYTVSVSAVCDDGDETSARNTTFRTACGVTGLPYSYDCEDLVSSQTPDCYTNLGSGYMTYTSSYYHGGNKAIEFYPNGQTGSNILVFPIFEQPTNLLKLDMWHRPEGESESGSFSVGYITDLSDTGSFVPVATYQASMGETYAEAIITFEDAPEDARIAMRHMPNSDYTNWYWFVDDIAVSLNDGSEPQGIDAADMAMVRLYPNPATTSVSVEFEGMASINVVDMNGRQVLTTEADSRATLDVSSLAKGAYFVRVTTTAGTAVSKLVVK